MESSLAVASQILEQPALLGATPLARDDDIPARIGKYRVLGPLGEGGMSVVYRARDEALDRQVALKVLHRHLARDPEARARFTREARAVARLTHRNIPEVYDFSGSGAEDSTARSYIVSELVDGASLARILRENKGVLPELGVAICLGVGHALAHAHKHQVIHRDVKPENVLVGRDGVAKLTDFGIAQVRGLESMTMTGTLIGSPAHMAPEQIDGTKDLDARVDVWGFGTVLYVIATGRLPFEAENPHHLLRKVVAGDYPDPRRASPHVDAELAAIIKRCLVVDRGARYPSLEAVLEDLQRWYDERKMAPPEVEVQEFMADPAGYTTLLVERLVTTNLALGDEALARGQTSVALERFGRVLALDPDSEVAGERLRSLGRHVRAKKVMLIGASALALAGISVATLFALRPGPTPPRHDGALLTTLADAPTKPVLVPRAPPAKADGVVAAPVQTSWGESFGDALGQESERVAALPSKVEHIDKPKDPTRDKPVVVVGVRARVSVEPAPVRMSVNGHDLVTPTDFVFERDKTYAVKLVHSQCADCGVDTQSFRLPVTASDGYEAHFVFRRKLEPAHLLVNCKRDGYVVDNKGGRYACDRRHEVPVDSTAIETYVLTAYEPDGTRFAGPNSFRLWPNADIVWTP